MRRFTRCSSIFCLPLATFIVPLAGWKARYPGAAEDRSDHRAEIPAAPKACVGSVEKSVEDHNNQEHAPKHYARQKINRIVTEYARGEREENDRPGKG